jgi:hypothetical protein
LLGGALLAPEVQKRRTTKPASWAADRVERPALEPPAARWRGLLTAAWADAVDDTIKPRIILLDSPGEGFFLGVDLADADQALPARHRIGLMIALVDRLRLIPRRLQAFVHWAPMNKESLPRPRGMQPLGVFLRVRSIRARQPG